MGQASQVTKPHLHFDCDFAIICLEFYLQASASSMVQVGCYEKTK